MPTTPKQLELPGFEEPWLTLPKAAAKLNVPVSTLRRAAKDGLIPTHRPFNTRVRVRLSELIAVVDGLQNGGQNNGQ